MTSKLSRKAQKRAYRWALLDVFEGKLKPEQINEKIQEYIKTDRESKRTLGFSILEGK